MVTTLTAWDMLIYLMLFSGSMEKGCDIWYTKCKEPVSVRVTYASSLGIREVEIRFSGHTGELFIQWVLGPSWG